jgi:hypothetical protein
MQVEELASFIKVNKVGDFRYPYGDKSLIGHHVRSVLYQHVHITDEHISECCAKASTYEEFIELCRPLAKIDTEQYLREKNRPVPKGRTRRRFK